MHCSSAPPLFRSTALRGGVYLAGAILFSLNYWLNHYFGPPEIHQIAYQLQFGTQMTAASDPAVVRKFVALCRFLWNLTSAKITISATSHKFCVHRSWMRSLQIAARSRVKGGLRKARPGEANP